MLSELIWKWRTRLALRRRIAEELQYHLDEAAAGNVACGMSVAEARKEALIRFGKPAAILGECFSIAAEDLGGLPARLIQAAARRFWLENSSGRDVYLFTFRTLARNPKHRVYLGVLLAAGTVIAFARFVGSRLVCGARLASAGATLRRTLSAAGGAPCGVRVASGIVGELDLSLPMAAPPWRAMRPAIGARSGPPEPRL